MELTKIRPDRCTRDKKKKLIFKNQLLFALCRPEIILQLKLHQPDKLLHKNHNQCKGQHQFYRYLPQKSLQQDIRRCMFHKQYTLLKFYKP